MTTDATKTIITKRFGKKVVVANPFDRQSIDEAISRGFKVVTGSELSKAEWDNVRGAKALNSSSDLFGSKAVASESIEPTEDMLRFAELAKRIAKCCMGIDIGVAFRKWDGAVAQYGNRMLTLNVKQLGNGFFSGAFATEQKLDLIVHKLGHEAGMHTEHNYHKQITKLAGQLVMIALEDQEFFKEGVFLCNKCGNKGQDDGVSFFAGNAMNGRNMMCVKCGAHGIGDIEGV